MINHQSPIVTETPTTVLLRDISAKAPNEKEKIDQLNKMVRELKSEIEKY